MSEGATSGGAMSDETASTAAVSSTVAPDTGPPGTGAVMSSAVASTDGRWDLVEENRQLREALESRATIERAKGVLMALHDCSEQEAFKILADTARRRHRKVRRVAEEFLLTLAAEAATRPRDPQPAAVQR